MTATDDLRDVVGFLGEVLPFSALSEDSRLDVARRLSIDYIPRRKGQSLDLGRELYIIRTGAFELRTKDNELIDRLGERELFGINTLMTGNPEGLKVYPIEDALVFKLAKNDFDALCGTYSAMEQYFHQVSRQRDRQSQLLDNRSPKPRFEQQLMQHVGDFVTQQPVTCSASASIREAAVIMREHRVSSLLLMDEGRLGGIVTDRDMRNRVVAEGLDVSHTVADIATLKPVTIDAQALLFDAQKLMGQHQIHHLPVLKGDTPIGMVTATDLVRAQQVSPLFLINDIQRQSDLETLADLRHQVPVLIHNWVQAEISPYEMGRILAAISDAFVQRCLALAQKEFGEPPLAYAWLAFGSQARMEQTFASDQDNGLILSREPTASEADYFKRLSDWVCKALDRCGYRLCPGDIMASNPRWRRTVEQWQSIFDDWIDQPTPEALMNGSIFFDMRVIDGDESLLQPIQSHLLTRAAKVDVFLAMLTQTALRNRPPIGFFRQFVLKSSGEHEDELDMKHRGVALVNDLARIYALASGSRAANTQERLKAAQQAELLDDELAQSLQEAWSLIAQLRIEAQSQDLRQGEAPGSFMDPDRLTSLMRAHLKGAFATIKRGQQAALQQFARGYNG